MKEKNNEKKEPVQITMSLTTLIISIGVIILLFIVCMAGANKVAQKESNESEPVNTLYSNYEPINQDNELTEDENEKDSTVIDDTTTEEDDTSNENKVNNNTTNIKGEKLLQYDNEFFELKDIAKEYRLSENIKNYKDFNYDLDGDGVTDKITIKRLPEEEEFLQEFEFKLNDKTFDKNFYNPEIYIVDLNENDDKLEVVIFDDGPSDDYKYTIYAKQGNEMVPLKYISGEELKSDKKGKFVIDNRYNWGFSPKTYFIYYDINNSKLEEKSLDLNSIKNQKYVNAEYYFSEKYSCENELFYNDPLINLEDVNNGRANDSVETLNHNMKFEIIDIGTYEDKNYDDNYTVPTFKVKLDDERIGYVFFIQLAG